MIKKEKGALKKVRFKKKNVNKRKTSSYSWNQTRFFMREITCATAPPISTLWLIGVHKI